jgi:hypothetical protein
MRGAIPPLPNIPSWHGKGKGKGEEVVPVLFFNEHHAMKAYWGVEV